MPDDVKTDPAAEIESIRNDEANPRHAAWTRGDKAATDYMASLYEKLYTGQSGPSAEAKSARTELDAIRNDKNHPKHEGFVNGDPQVKEHMDSLYRQLAPEPDSEHDGRAIIPENLDESGQMAIDHLRQQWGHEFERNYNAGMTAIGALPAEQVEEVLGAYSGIANDPNVVNVLSYIGRGRWDDIPPELFQKIEACYPQIGSDERIKNLVQTLGQQFRK